MPQPMIRTEIDEIVDYVDTQLQAIRDSVHGLSDEQARSRPCRSGLSLLGLIKHCCWIFDVSTGEGEAGAFYDGFAPSDSETMDELLARFDRGRTRYLAAGRTFDPEAEMMSAPAPWDDLEPRPIKARYNLLHHIEEFARHAGHADILREQLDGAQAYPLKFAVEGRPGNDFVQPWTPAD